MERYGHQTIRTRANDDERPRTPRVQSYTSAAEVTSHLGNHAQKPVKPRTSFVAKIHEDKYDPNFPMLLPVSVGQLDIQW
ncbi:hypothetical protein HD554DRAFT_2014736 [Boletus coccyginus]|nr:hypothetical protein HD554DRAFT_2014736 [Boletus coccyginus]